MLTKKERLEEIIRYYSDSKPTAFAKFLGVAPSTISTWLARDTFDYDLLFAKCEDINTDWLLSGEGTMILEDKSNNTNTINKIPLVETTAIAGFGNYNFSISNVDIKEYYVIPKFKHCKVDFMIELSGDSMIPTYNRGDIVACTIIKEATFIQWNKCHIIATAHQGSLCKRIMPSEKTDHVKIISDNPAYPPIDLPLSEIKGLALVVGVVRLE